MPRPKGSKNKEKAEVKVAEVLPEPMETVKPSKGKLCGACSHDTAMHYGSEKKWCNTSGCPCLELR